MKRDPKTKRLPGGRVVPATHHGSHDQSDHNPHGGGGGSRTDSQETDADPEHNVTPSRGQEPGSLARRDNTSGRKAAAKASAGEFVQTRGNDDFFAFKSESGAAAFRQRLRAGGVPNERIMDVDRNTMFGRMIPAPRGRKYIVAVELGPSS